MSLKLNTSCCQSERYNRISLINIKARPLKHPTVRTLSVSRQISNASLITHNRSWLPARRNFVWWRFSPLGEAPLIKILLPSSVGRTPKRIGPVTKEKPTYFFGNADICYYERWSTTEEGKNNTGVATSGSRMPSVYLDAKTDGPLCYLMSWELFRREILHRANINTYEIFQPPLINRAKIARLFHRRN